MFDNIKRLNTDIVIYSVEDDCFADYGRILDDFPTEEIMKEAEAIAMPAEGPVYIPSIEVFEKSPVKQWIKSKVFGELPVQIGYCYGHNSVLNATEWHISSEVNIAVTSFVLILGQRSQIKNGKLDSAVMKAFYVPEGTAIERYSTTLHFCPCEVQKSGFRCVVALLEGTNTPLDNECEDKLLFRKNKWMLSHIENKLLIAKGAVPGIMGRNYEIKY